MFSEPNVDAVPPAAAVTSVASVSELAFSPVSLTRGEPDKDDEREEDDEDGITGIGGGTLAGESPRSKHTEDDEEEELLLSLRIIGAEDDTRDSCECPVVGIGNIFVGDSLVPDEATISDDDADVEIGDGNADWAVTVGACAGADDT